MTRYDVCLNLFFLHHGSVSVFVHKSEQMKDERSERQSVREQVLEWLMADSVNSQRCPFPIKGMNFCFVSPTMSIQQHSNTVHQAFLADA